MRKILEGSRAVAEAVALCRPHVISAYPITPQTHIVENLSQMVADGDLKAVSVNVESEHSAASVVLGASLTGARAYTATTSQGLFLMGEVLFNIAGMRAPVVLTCANRAVSAPISIWNDQQDSIAMRDSGWIQLYAENNQEAVDMHIQAFRLAEDPRISLPVMVCMDGFVLTHCFEPVDIPTQDNVDQFLPPYRPEEYLTPERPLTFGPMMDPNYYAETRYAIHQTMLEAIPLITQIAAEYEHMFGRPSGGLLESYRTEDAERILVAMGSLAGNIKEVVDALRDDGQKVGLVRLITYRPFPSRQLVDALSGAKAIGVLDKDISLGYEGALATDLRSAFSGQRQQPVIRNFVLGLGGRDVPTATIHTIFEKLEEGPAAVDFIDVNPELKVQQG